MICRVKDTALRSLISSTVLLLLGSELPVSAEPSKNPLSPRWELIAQSDFVARAKLQVPLEALREAATSKHRYIDLKVDIEEQVKGSFPGKFIVVRYYTEPSDYSPSARFLEAHNGREVIIFIVQVDEAPGAAKGYYLAGHSSDALASFNSQEFSSIADEVRNQQEVVQNYGSLAVGKASAGDAEIGTLLSDLVQVGKQEAAWVQLLKLAKLDIPAIVRVMDDQRRVPDFDLYLPNPPGFGEAVAHHRPARIIGAASVLLAHIAGTSFRDAMYSGGSEREGVASMHGWRVWCNYNF